jgi:hypothetical protein
MADDGFVGDGAVAWRALQLISPIDFVLRHAVPRVRGAVPCVLSITGPQGSEEAGSIIGLQPFFEGVCIHLS